MHVMTRKRDDQGVVAIMVALLAVVLLSVAALTVDIGQALVQKRDIQKQTDFAALAGAEGDDLPMTAAGIDCSITTPGSYGGKAALAADPAIIDAAAYLSAQPHAGDVTPDQLVDCQLGNGEAAYGMFRRDSAGVHLDANPNQLSVISQPKRVDFGFATIMGFDNVDVAGQATVEIETPLINTLPLYAFSGCDYGSQTIAQPTNGHSSDGVNLAYNSGSTGNNTYITLATLAVNPASTTTPPTVTLGSSSTSITLTGTHLDRVTKVGFFRSSATPPLPQEIVAPDFTTNLAGTSLTVTALPTTITNVQDTWFVRVYGPSKDNGTSPDWTPVTDKGNANNATNLAALPFNVGNATLNCAQGSSDGNFGTLLLPNTSSGAPNGQSDNIAYNIADGLQHSLGPFPEPKRTPPDFNCVAGQDGAVLWPTDGTNCVDTKTGLDSAAAEAGFVTGVASKPGLLTDVSSGSKCPFNRPTGTTHQTTAPTGQTINNDVLSCYFTNDTITVGDVSSQSYSGGIVIDQSIYKSPRFVQVPVLGRMPTTGGSDKYEIVDFRPGFITDQPAAATRLSGVPTSGNGITWTGNNKLQAVNVIFLNLKALPNPPLDENGQYIPYAGSGKKIPLLVN
jgi:hypothetical protein